VTILYLSYGRGPHEAEIVFSLMTAWRWLAPGEGGVNYLIYTDHPEQFEGLPVGITEITGKQWEDWSGPRRYQHRRKIPALRHALEVTGGTVVLLDGDTWFRRSPAILRERVGPGRSLMHLQEARIDKVPTPCYEATMRILESRPFASAAGGIQRLPGSTWMWNAGVVGLCRSDAGLTDRVLHLTDDLCAEDDSVHVLEQLAFSHILDRETILAEAADIVFHYWPAYLHRPFRDIVCDLIDSSRDMPLRERAEWCYQRRPRPTPSRRAKVIVKNAAIKLGLLRGRIRTNEW
jgi:hypothetical protein